MAEEEALMPDGSPIPRMALSEIGYNGLKVASGIIYEEAKRELRWPNSIRTFKEMRRDTTISAALKAFELLVSRVNWSVLPPEGATDAQVKRADFVKQCMHDMDHTWFNFIKEVSSVFTFGFDVHEIVPRRRRYKNGSKYNDGLIGLKKLAPRSQDTITKWIFSDDKRELVGIEQTVVQNQYGLPSDSNVASNTIIIPRERCLLFRTDPVKDNPEGQSPLLACYTAYRIRAQLEEIEAIGYSKNVNGVPVVWIHPKYMANDASEADKAVYAHYKQLVRNLHMNEQTGIVMPLLYDPESKQPMFKFELLSVNNTTAQYLADSIQRWDNKILTSLFADVLRLGQDGVGSYSLADSKTNMLAMAIESRLKEIRDVLNSELIPFLFRLNGWREEQYPTFEFGDLEDADLEAFSKAIQRIKAVGLIAPTRDNVNHIAEVLKLPDRIPDDMSQGDINELLGKATTRSGDSLNTPTGGMNGTAKATAANDNSSLNTENTA